jgi:1,4-alpha-glucan branching enzyme
MTQAFDYSPSTEWRPDPGAVAALVGGRHGDPFSLLGMHARGNGPLSVRVFWPGAEFVSVLEANTGRVAAQLERIHGDGFFAGPVEGRRTAFPYRLRLSAGDATWEAEDPYRFPPVLGAMDVYLMAEGNHRRIYERLGAHPMTLEGVAGVAFAVWAPNAQRVSVVGEFNYWDGRRHPMRKRVEAGVWEIFLPGVQAGALYKYELIGAHGALLPQKTDPVGFEQEPRPRPLTHRSASTRRNGPTRIGWPAAGQAEPRRSISIYEVASWSWRRKEANRMLSYDELGDELIPYVKDMGFTHIECLPVGRAPVSGSWGYQPVGLFAPTSRFGNVEQFARFVDRCHRADLGVSSIGSRPLARAIRHGLAFRRHSALRARRPSLGFHRDWNTLIYNFGRRRSATS